MHGGYSMASHWSRCISHKIVCRCSEHEECGLRSCCWGSNVTVWLHFLTCHDDACSLLIKRNPPTHINTHTHEYLTRAIRVWAFPASTLTPAPKQTSPWQLQAQKRKRKKRMAEEETGKRQQRERSLFLLIQTRFPYLQLTAHSQLDPPLRQRQRSTGYWGNETRGISLPNTAY